MISKLLIKKHNDRLYKFYIKKGLSKKNADKYAKMRCEKLQDFDSKNSYYQNLKKLIPFICNEIKNPKILYIGCGSGEYVIVMNLLGYNAHGSDIYLDEINIAKELATDLGLTEDIFKFSNVGKPLSFGDQSFDLITMFSVMEHLNNEIYISLCNDCLRIAKIGIYSLVPNRFKFVDDHTRVPFLGFVPSSIIPFLLKILRRDYVLSETGTWDVTLRSYKFHKKLSKKLNCKIKLVEDNYIYPSLNLIPKLRFISINGFKSFLHNLHVLMLRLFFNRRENFYPYLNLLITKN